MVEYRTLYFSKSCNPPVSNQIPTHLYYVLQYSFPSCCIVQFLNAEFTASRRFPLSCLVYPRFLHAKSTQPQQAAFDHVSLPSNAEIVFNPCPSRILNISFWWNNISIRNLLDNYSSSASCSSRTQHSSIQARHPEQSFSSALAVNSRNFANTQARRMM